MGGLGGGHSREVNYSTLILSLCFRPSDAGPLGSVVARRYSLPSMLGFPCVLWKEICQGPLAIGWVQHFHQPYPYCSVVPTDQRLI